MTTLGGEQRMYPLERCVFASSDSPRDHTFMVNLGARFVVVSSFQPSVQTVIIASKITMFKGLILIQTSYLSWDLSNSSLR